MSSEQLKNLNIRKFHSRADLKAATVATNDICVVDNEKPLAQLTTMPTASADWVDEIVQYVGTTTSDYKNGYTYKCMDGGGYYYWQEVQLQGLYSKLYTTVTLGGSLNSIRLTHMYIDPTNPDLYPINGGLIVSLSTWQHRSQFTAEIKLCSGKIKQKILVATGDFAKFRACWYEASSTSKNLAFAPSDGINPFVSDTTVYVNVDAFGLNNDTNKQTYATNSMGVSDFSKFEYIPEDSVQLLTMPTADATNVGQIVQYIGTTDANYTNGYFYKCVSDGQEPATYSWTRVDVQPAPSGLPDQTGQSGKFLTTDGTDASWGSALINNTTQTYSLAINASATANRSTAINGDTSSAYSVVVGQGGSITNSVHGTALGSGARLLNADYAIQLGGGASVAQNGDANTFKVANGNGNFEIMSADGTVPADRLTKAINKYSSMPTAASTNEGWIVQYTGTTDATYTHGYIYECIGTTAPGSATATQTTGSSLTDLAVNVTTFETQITTSGTYLFVRDGNYWTLNYGPDINDLEAEYGITYTGTPVSGDVITVEYTAEGTVYAWERVDVQPTPVIPDPLPSQTGNAGKFLTTDGTDASWSNSVKETNNNEITFWKTGVIGEGILLKLGYNLSGTSPNNGVYLAVGNGSLTIQKWGSPYAGTLKADVVAPGSGTTKTLGISTNANTSWNNVYTKAINAGSGAADITVPTTGGTMVVATPPSADGTYVLKATVADGVVTTTWVAE